jgi:hypothetical protein
VTCLVGLSKVHKRFDPMYVDAKDKIQGLGPFSYMYRCVRSSDLKRG